VKPQIDPELFFEADIRTGTILSARTFPEARKPAYLLEVDFGAEIGILRTSAQITGLYAPETLSGKQIVAVVNFPARQIGPHKSECLILGVADNEGRISLLRPDHPVSNGQAVH